MAIVRKYNKTTKKWEPVASSDATGIYTNNPILADNKGTISIEDSLVKDRQDIEILKKNVSWLARHGGSGGWGNGGGGSNNTVEVLILDPFNRTDPVSEIIWNKEINQIYYKVDSKAAGKYTVIVRVDGKAVFQETGVKKGTVKSFDASLLGVSKSDVVLQVSALDESESEFSARCDIKISSITLNSSPVNITQKTLRETDAKLQMSYRVSISGDYRLYFAKSVITLQDGVFKADGKDLGEAGQYIELLGIDTTASFIDIPISDVHGNGKTKLVDKNAMPGSYPIYFLLANTRNNRVSSGSVVSIINVVVTDGILVTPVTGIDPLSPISISQDSIFNLQFTTISENTSTYNYEIKCGSTTLASDRNLIYGNQVTVPINLAQFPIFNTYGKFTIEIIANQGTIRDVGRVYISVIEPNTRPVKAYMNDLNKYLVYDYTFWGEAGTRAVSSKNITYRNENFSTSGRSKTFRIPESSLDLYNIGSDSGIQSDYKGAYTFTHTAYGVLTKSGVTSWFPSSESDVNCAVTSNSYTFTVQIAYHIGKDPDDNAVIYKLGDYNPKDQTGAGILITPRKYYVKVEGVTLVGSLQDNSFQQVDIVLTRPGQNGVAYATLSVYQNGIILQSIEINTSRGLIYNMGNISRAFLACSGTSDDNGRTVVNNSTTIHVYSTRFFNIALNTGQIVCSYINNYMNFKRNEDGSLNSGLVSQLLRNNSIRTDEEVTGEGGTIDTSAISSIYNLRTGEFKNLASISGTSIVLDSALTELPIPIVTMSVNWTYSQFSSTSNGGLDVSSSSNFEYKIGTTSIKSSQVTIELQGTTSMNYNIKNLKITFEGNQMFSPKSDWFPEKSFTLKADVVDSGHINNAVIGKFINETFNDPTNNLINIADCYPAKSKVDALKASGSLPPDVTVKPTIEGFPVLLIVNFKSETGDSRDIRVLGIYSFNLGRESEFNQGYKVPKYLKNPYGDVLAGKDVTFPNLFSQPSESELDNTINAVVYEGERSQNCTTVKVEVFEDRDTEDAYDYSIIKMGRDKYSRFPANIVRDSTGFIKYNGVFLEDEDGQQIKWSPANLRKFKFLEDGYFWSNDATYVDKLWKRVYAENTDEATKAFRNLHNTIASKMEYINGSAKRAYNTSYNKYIISSSEGESITTTRDSQGTTITMTRPQAKEGIDLSVKNTAFYYVICMLFGLVDSLGKNLQFKFWLPKNGSPGGKYWTPSFYDMDTALGLGNAGAEEVTTTALENSITNGPDNKVMLLYGIAEQTDNTVFTVYSNKLWGCIESEIFFDTYFNDYKSTGDYHFYSIMWSDLRSTVLKSVDEFFEKHFTTQLSKCGELIFNYDYNVKYIKTAQRNYLHGTRMSFIKNWLDERVTFLDSVFGYRAGLSNEASYLVDNNIDTYNISWKNSISVTHDSGSITMPVTVNSPVIMKSNIGNKSVSYTYVKDGKETDIIVADSKDTPDIQTYINNSDKITSLSDLKSIKINSLTPTVSSVVKNKDGSPVYTPNMGNIYSNYGSLSSLKELNLSGITTFTSSFNIFELLKTFDSSGYKVNPEYFALQTLNFSGFKSGGIQSVDLSGTTQVASDIVPDVYKNPFKNITYLNVSESDINNVIIPVGVSLYYLNVSNSSVQTLTLEKQPLLTNIDLRNCKVLNTLAVTNCENIRTVKLDYTNRSIKQVVISGMSNLETVELISNDNWSYLPKININSCPKLKKIVISGCRSASLGSTGASTISLNDLPELDTLSISDSNYTEINTGNSKLTSLRTLSLDGTTIKTLRTQDSSNSNGIDLKGYRLDSFSISSNPSLEYVVFDNIQDQPTPLKTKSFYECSSLKRVYGNFTLMGSLVFSRCPLFTIHGGRYNGINVVNQYGRYIHPTESDRIYKNDNFIFQEGNSVTNLKLVATDVNSCFSYSGVDLFDIYYALYSIGPDVRSIDSLFFSCGDIGFAGDGWKSDTIDNSLNRHTFDKCVNITNINGLFYGTNISGRLYSPSVVRTGGTEVIKEDGLFSPLRKLTQFINVINSKVYFDRYLFRVPEGSSKFEITNLHNFSTSIVFNDINTLTFSTFDSITKNYKSGLNKIGNLDGMFSDLPKLTRISHSLNTNYINYDNITEELGIFPASLVNIVNTCISDSGSGKMNLDKIFKDPRKLENISSSFIVSNLGVGDEKVKLELTDNTLKDFDSLKTIAFETGNYNDYSSGYHSFTGAGLKKYSVGGFPYRILQNCKNHSKITMLVSLFRGMSVENITGDAIELPGSTFAGCTELRNISYCFYDFKTPYRLTNVNEPSKRGLPEPFADCINLSCVAYTFSSTTGGTFHKMVGMIPARLFYHGDINYTIRSVGSDHTKTVDIDSKEGSKAVKTVISTDETANTRTTTRIVYNRFSEIPNNTNQVVIDPTTVITTTVQVDNTQTGQNISRTSTTSKIPDLAENTHTFSKVVKIPRQTIEIMRGCFQNCNAEEYDYLFTTDTGSAYFDMPDYNIDYQPFKYVLINNTWSEVKPNKDLYTYMWKWSGRANRYDDYVVLCNQMYTRLLRFESIGGTEFEYNIDWLDDVVLDPSKTVDTLTTSSTFEGVSCSYSGGFAFAPDLLRYCTANVDVVDLFRDCGPTRQSFGNLAQYRISRIYGIQGRIPPYMFKPTPNIGDMTRMFMNCKMLGYYISKNGVIKGYSVTIPPSLFKYIKTNRLYMNDMFNGCMWPNNLTLNVMNFTVPKIDLYIQGMFRFGMFRGISNLTDVFNQSNIYIQKMESCFRLSSWDPDTGSYNNGIDRNLKVTFNNMFSRNNWNKTDSIDENGNASRSSDWYVFDGFAKMNEVPNRFLSKELSSEPIKANYRQYGE